MSRPSPKAFAALLQDAVNETGILSRAYQQFHSYSVGNQLLAWWQCADRELQPGPMATYPRWKELGRQVKKGEKAITLCMPITVKRTRAEVVQEPTTDEPGDVMMWFVCKPRWFVLSQTDGEPLPEAETPDWDTARALDALAVQEIPFDHVDGNCLGFARDRLITVNPVNPLPHKTRFHELAHVLLGHTAEGLQADSDVTPRTLRECEAEAVALLCCATLDLPGIDDARGYIQHWWGLGHEIPEPSVRRILKVADQILKAGTGTNQGASS